MPSHSPLRIPATGRQDRSTLVSGFPVQTAIGRFGRDLGRRFPRRIAGLFNHLTTRWVPPRQGESGWEKGSTATPIAQVGLECFPLDFLDGFEAVVCEYDLNSRRFTFVSRCVSRILGYSVTDWYENRVFWLDLLPRHKRAEILGPVELAIESGGTYSVEHPVTTVAGETRWLRNLGYSTDADGGRLLRCILLDVTDRRRKQEEELLHRQFESIGTLAGGIAHDFNNLLTPVLGNLSLVRLELDDIGKTGISKLLDEIEGAGEDARRVAGQLSTFAPGGRPVRRCFRLEPMLLELRPTSDGVEVDVSLATNLPEAFADPQQLGQVFFELVENAKQAMPEGGRLEVEARQASIRAGDESRLERGTYIAISFRDHGVGIPQQLVSKVFDPYFSTRSRRGFGLTIAYSIMRGHGGHLSLESELEQGTKVTVWVPAFRQQNQQEAVPLQVPVPVRRLLLMDDEPSVRRVAGRMLRHLGWEVTTSSDGLEAVEAYRNALGRGERFHLVLLDLTIPDGMGGAEAMVELLRLDPSVRAIVCSGYSDDPTMSRYQEHGFAGVLSKPFGLNDLRQGLDSAISAEASR